MKKIFALSLLVVMLAAVFALLDASRCLIPYRGHICREYGLVLLDFAIVLAAFVMRRMRGITTFPPSTLGKASTVCQVLMIWTVLAANALDAAAPNMSWFYILAAALAVASGIDYGIKGWRRMFPAPAPKA